MARSAIPPLAGRVVVITGADTESGAASAQSCVASGASVVLVGVDAGAVGILAAELIAGGARCAMFIGDPRDDAERAALAELVAELFPAAD